MRTLLYLSASIALLTLSCSTIVLTRAGIQTRNDVHQIATETQQTLRDIDESVKVQNISLVQDEMNLDAVLESLDSAASEQRTYWQKTSADSDKTVKALRLAVDRASLLLDHTDKQLNGVVLPDADRELTATAQSAQMTIDSLGHTSDALAFQLNDVDIGPTLANIDESSARLANTMANLQDASGHANKILDDGQKTADYYERKLTTPASFAHRLAMTLLDVGSKLGNIFAGFVR